MEGMGEVLVAMDMGSRRRLVRRTNGGTGIRQRAEDFLAHLAIGALRREIASISRVISFVLALAFLMVYELVMMKFPAL
jgi:hypothetical protein